MSKENNLQTLIDIILKSKDMWVKSEDLANILGVSKRTVRSYVKEINKSEKVILSSGIGYKLNHKLNDDFNFDPYDDIEIRQHNLICRIIISKSTINIFDIAEEFNISEATLYSDLKFVKQFFYENSLDLKVKNWEIQLLGLESDKRQTLKALVEKEISRNGSMEYLQINEKEQHLVSEIVLSTLEKNGIFINDFMIRDVLLHINIGILRMQGNQFLDDKGFEHINLNNDSVEYSLAKEIAEKIEHKLNIKYIKSELDSLVILLSGKLMFNQCSENTDNMMDEYISPEVKIVTENALSEITNQFNFNFESQELKIRIMIHIQNLYQRAKYNSTVKNPYHNELKIRYPLVYEIAISLAVKIQSYLKISVSDDEIAYLALHVGSIVEEQQKSDRLIAIVYSPDSYLFTNKLLKKLETKFIDDIILKKIVYTEQEAIASQNQCDFFVTTMPEIAKIPSKKIVEITPFLSKTDLNKVNEKIIMLKNDVEKNHIKSYIKKFFKKELFYSLDKHINEIETISYMCRDLEQYGYVNEDYKSLVIEREQLSSTVFRKFLAVPHTLSQKSKQTTISILINKEEIQWNGELVKVVILLSVKESDKKIFNELLTILIGLLNNDVLFNSLLFCDTYEKVIDLFNNFDL